MKPSVLLFVLALVLGGLVSLFLFTDSGVGGGEVIAEDPVDLFGPTAIERGPASLAVAEPAEAEDPDREAVVDKAALKAAREEQLLADARAKGPFLVGQVLDSQGFPVPNAAVKLSAAGPAGQVLSLGLGSAGFLENTTTDINGAYKAPRKGLIGDTVRVRVRGKGFLAYDEEVLVDPVAGDRRVPIVELELGVSLSGIVTDAQGQPVEGAEVSRTTREFENRFRGPRMFRAGGTEGSGTVRTDAEGRFELGNEPAGEYVIVVEHERFPEGRLEGNAPYAGFADSSLVIQLEPTARIQGRIEGFPLGREYVNVYAVPTELNKDEELDGPEAIFMASGLTSMDAVPVESNGRFVLEGLEPGRSYDITAKVQNGMMQLAPCSDTAQVVAGDGEALLTWDGGATVTFRLAESGTNGNVPGASIRYMWTKDDRSFLDFGAKRRDFTSSRIELGELRPSPAPGRLTMAISSPGYLDSFHEDIEVDENAEVDLGTIYLDKAPVLRVQVLEAGSDDPLSRARLVLTPDLEDGESQRNRWRDFGIEDTAPQSSKGRTERDGWCDLAVSAARTATLTVTRTGYADLRVEGLALPARGQAEHTVRMVEGGTLEVQVLDTKGEPVAKARVEYESPSGVEGSGTTSRKGSIKLKDLEVGEYSLRASRPDGGGMQINFGGEREDRDIPWATATVASGASFPVTLRVPTETTLRGTLTVNGRPVEGAEVRLMSGASPDEFDDEVVAIERRMRRWGGGETTKTDKFGRFEMGELDFGPHHLRVTVDAGQPDHFVASNLREGANTVNADIRTGSLRGRVVDSTGKPVPGALVTVRPGHGHGSGQGVAAWWGDEPDDGARADDDGRFMVEHLPLGQAFVAHGKAAGFVDASSDEFEVTETSLEAEVTIVLPSGASIRVTLVGEPSNFERIQAERVAEDGSVLESSSRFVQGSEVVLRDLEPGTWNVALAQGWGSDEVGAEQQVVVEPGVEAKLTIVRD